MTSPFYEGTNFQFAWNSSALGTLKDCARKYQLQYLEGWQPKGEAIHLRFGTLYHRGLELFDIYQSEGSDEEEALDQVVQWLMENTWDDREYIDDEQRVAVLDTGHPWHSDHPAFTKKNRETLVRSIIWYVDHYKDDPTKTHILETGKPALELTFKLEIETLTPRGEPYLLTGHMDRLVQYGDDLFVMDRKTTGSALSGYFFDRFTPDNQMSLYTFAARVVYDVPVSGVIIDAAQIAVGFTNFSRGMTTRSKGQLEEWLVDTAHWFKLAERYAAEGYWPMNDQACHKYDGCQYRHICKLDPGVRHHFLETDFERNMHSSDRILTDA
jgi:hypothetical protein